MFNRHLIWFPIILAFFLFFACGPKSVPIRVEKKRMPDLHFARWAEPDTSSAMEDQISSSLELYGVNPEVFGDPVGIIDFSFDSARCMLERRIMGVIVTATKWEPPLDIIEDTIIGGLALACQFDAPLESLDSCWAYLAKYARVHGDSLIPPGIEIYKDFDAEGANDTVLTELIIRVK
jgi:hypothetical protein